MIGRPAGYLLNVIYTFVLLVGLPWLVYRSIRTGRYQRGLAEKLLGQVPRLEPSDSPVIWLHAVSVGEVNLLRSLIAELNTRLPEARLCISTTTESGMELVHQAFPKLTRFFLPLDFTWAVAEAFRRLRPNLLVLVELEVWPNLIAAAKKSGCSVAIINGRLSLESFRGYSKLKGLLRSSFQAIDWVAAQDKSYAERFVAMGVAETKVVDVGNLKFDNAEMNRDHPEIIARKRSLGLDSSDRIWVVGSTQSPEEQYVLGAFQRLKADFPKLRLIVVPRHPERFEEVARWLEATPFLSVRRSQMSTTINQDWDILLGDTLGELRWWWGLADIAFVGGSFGDRGGQNMIEPAALAVSTAVGNNTKNFADVMRMLRQENAIAELDSPSQLYDWARQNLSDDNHRIAMGYRARSLVARQRGALERTLAGLAQMLGEPPAMKRSRQS